MRSRHLTTRAAAAAVALVGLPALSTTAAYAVGVLQASTQASLSASSASWSAVPTTLSAGPYPTGALTLTYQKVGKPAPAAQYLWIVNTGTLPVLGVSTDVSSTGTGRAELCSGTWNETTGTCSGTITTLDTTAAGATSNALDLPVGSRVRVKATLSQLQGPTTTMTVSISVPRSDTRPGSTSDS